jgi:hypothetical protein
MFAVERRCRRVRLDRYLASSLPQTRLQPIDAAVEHMQPGLATRGAAKSMSRIPCEPGPRGKRAIFKGVIETVALKWVCLALLALWGAECI